MTTRTRLLVIVISADRMPSLLSSFWFSFSVATVKTRFVGVRIDEFMWEFVEVLVDEFVYAFEAELDEVAHVVLG